MSHHSHSDVLTSTGVCNGTEHCRSVTYIIRVEGPCPRPIITGVPNKYFRPRTSFSTFKIVTGS